MAPRYERRKKTYTHWAVALGFGVVFSPLSLSHLDFRATFVRGLEVTTDKASPAYAAFEDLRESYPGTPEIPEPTNRLSAGTKFEYHPERSSAPSSTTIRRVTLAGLKVHAPPTGLPQKDMNPRPFYVAGETVLPSSSIRPPTAFAPTTMKSDVASPTPVVGTLAERAKQLVQKELRGSPPDQGETLHSKLGTPIYVARGDQPIPRDVATADQNAVPGETYKSTVSSFAPATDDPKAMILKGQIEMTGGLAFVGPETPLLVKRVFEGQTKESGRIWITDARFEIHVQKPVGYLVAELRNRDGQVLGRGELNLMELKEDGRAKTVDDIRLALHPVTETASIRAISGYSHDGQMMPMKSAHVNVDAYMDNQAVNDEGFAPPTELSQASSFVAEAGAKESWPTMVVGQAGQTQNIRLFANSMVQALIDLNLKGTDRSEAIHNAIVWGSVTREGEAAAGVKIEMAGGYTPIYFNEMYLPDSSLHATSKNGLFAFLNVKPGVQALRVKAAGRIYPAQIFPTAEQHVSSVSVDLKDKVVSEFKILDVLDMNREVPAKLKLVGSGASMDMNGEGYIQYGSPGGTLMAEADAGPQYEVSRVTINGDSHTVHVPVVKRDWLNQLAVEQRIVPVEGTGTIVGFVDDQDFEVTMSGAQAYQNLQIVYFDAQGRPLPSGRTGIAGGGFAIFNAPAGMQTVYIYPGPSREAYSQVVVNEPGVVNVMTWSQMQ